MLFVIAKEEKKFLEILQSILFFDRSIYWNIMPDISVEPAIMPYSQTDESQKGQTDESRGQEGPMNKVCPSFCLDVFLEFALLQELSMVLGAIWCYA